jgi:acyl-CoA synthetase (NDP forming)
VAIIGASKGDGHGARLIPNLSSYGYGGEIIPVNPKHDEIAGFKSYPSIEHVPGRVDLATIVVGAESVADRLRECVRAEVGAVVIMAAGFAEVTDHVGRQRQRHIDDIIRGSGIVVLGPNSEGFINIRRRISLTFGAGSNALALKHSLAWLPDGADPVTEIAGSIALVAQSGGLGFSIFARGLAIGAGFSHVISVGNEADIDVLDCVDYLIEQPEVAVIGMYVEGLRRPERFAAVAQRARSRGKALVLGKAGTTEVGRQAALSHTGHLAGPTEIYAALTHRLGIVPVDDQEELLDACRALSTNSPLEGTNVAAVTYSGGSGVWMADALERAGLSLPELDSDRRASIGKLLPDFASTRNPVDVTAASKVGLAKVMREIATAPYIDALVLITTLNATLIAEREFEDLRVLATEHRKPIVLFSYSTDPDPLAIRICRDLRLPIYPSSGRAAAALKALQRVGTIRRDQTDHATVTGIRSARLPGGDGQGRVPEYESTALMGALGFQVAPSVLATTEQEAVAAAERLDRPVALKLQAPSLVHKSTVGGVLLNLVGADAVREGFQHLVEQVGAGGIEDLQGVLVQEMITDGLEMLVGVDNKSGFGPMMMVGFGGAGAEALRDVTMGVAPLTLEDASQMIESLRLSPLLSGFVGGKTYDVAGLVKLLVELSEWAAGHGDQIEELDLNPVIIGEQSVTIVDSLLVRKASGASAE